MTFGVINVFKPGGSTSRDIVNQVQRACPGKLKAGHAGTLDPLATGVLVVAVGPATKLIQYVQHLRKTYVGRFRLGLRSDTEDITGEVVAVPDDPLISESELQTALHSFVGMIQQTPPQFSAVKVDGQRAYKAARRGETLDIKARPVEVYSIRLLEFNYPDFEIEIVCGKGTYVRTLGRDIAKSLKSDTVMTTLTRTAIGDFRIEDAHRLSDVPQCSFESMVDDPLSMVGSLPTVRLDSVELERLRHGKRLSSAKWQLPDSITETAATNHDGQLLAVLGRKSESEFGSKINFVPQLY
ncbi:tRNA pseudouridine(55) synthase TruB [Mariniblastus fucicola]|uniref:tRNA pseudouridine synthase B n=1 Tax=Mariniblastus fucicola TaxID=980251 RepID=A0A5B9PDI9_9BACT|nr:tRNA pseudouridine(55) synthase TruB [Mariniblastus fucicola]QEG23255.1 tRNA pseudouridine synthase B [Mariniblastus fucicola]